MTDPIPTEAVEAAATALLNAGLGTADAGWYGAMAAEAAAPHIAAQATAQIERDYMTRSRTAGEYLQEANRLRARIEALRDVTRLNRDAQAKNRDAMLRDGDIALAEYCKGRVFSYGVVLDALDALLRERAR